MAEPAEPPTVQMYKFVASQAHCPVTPAVLADVGLNVLVTRKPEAFPCAPVPIASTPADTRDIAVSGVDEVGLAAAEKPIVVALPPLNVAPL